MISVNTLGELVVFFCVVRVSRCRNELNVTRCPDPDVNTVEWKQYDKACQDKNSTYKFHCQQDNTGNVTTHRSYCAVPKQCLAGHYPFINGNTAECQRCSKGTYQTNGKISYEYKHPSCDENWSKPNPGEVECRSGSTTEDRRFKCNWTDSYIPDSNSTVCLCFSHDDVCSCYKKPCEDGKERNENYTCLTSTNTSLKPPKASNKTPDWVIIVVLIAIVMAVIIVWRIYRMKRKKSEEDSAAPNNLEGEHTSDDIRILLVACLIAFLTSFHPCTNSRTTVINPKTDVGNNNSGDDGADLNRGTNNTSNVQQTITTNITSNTTILYDETNVTNNGEIGNIVLGGNSGTLTATMSTGSQND